MEEEYDPDELVGLEMEPEEALERLLRGASVEGPPEMEPDEPEGDSQ